MKALGERTEMMITDNTTLNRRKLLRGLIAAPSIVAIGSLMPIRGIVMPIVDCGDITWTASGGGIVRVVYYYYSLVRTRPDGRECSGVDQGTDCRIRDEQK